MKNPIVLALATVFSLAACGSDTVTQSGITLLGANPALSGGTYSSGGGLTVATKLRNFNGLTGICGAWSESAVQAAFTKDSAVRVLETGSVHLGKEKLLTNLNFMQKVPPTADYSTAEANCIRTKRPWQPGDEARVPTIRIPKQIAYRDRSGGGGAVIIMFNQTGPGAFSKSLDLFGISLKDTENSLLSRSPTLTGGRYTSGGGLTIAAELQDIDGIAYVCGVWAESKKQSRSTQAQALQVLASGSIQLGGRRVVQDLRFMKKTAPRKSYGGKPGRCVSTGLPWNPGYAGQPLAIAIPRQIVFQDQTQVIYFEPSGPGA